MNAQIKSIDPRAEAFIGGARSWWDVYEQKFVNARTVYLPQGCPDWGTKGGTRNKLCTFCSLPDAVKEYEEVFYDGQRVPHIDQVTHFGAALRHVVEQGSDFHTLFVFNAGSFLAKEANPIEVWGPVIDAIKGYSNIRRLVVESRASLMTKENIQPIVERLGSAGVGLTIRIGVETQDDHLRLKVLKKGHTQKQIEGAVNTAHELGVLVGAYVLLKPAIHDDLRVAMGKTSASANEVTEWTEDEARSTLDWVLGRDNLAMDEAYFGATCVAEGALLQKSWQTGDFVPATLSSVLHVLQYGADKYGPKVHLLPMKDTPKFVAVSSNHTTVGLPEDLNGAQGCDKAFHSMLQNYRETMDLSVLNPPACATCNP